MTNKKRKRHSKNDASNKNQKSPTNKEQRITSPSTIKRTKSNESSSLLEKKRARLSGGHFRMINEKLYTRTGKEALHYFREDSSLFNLYHEGSVDGCRQVGEKHVCKNKPPEHESEPRPFLHQPSFHNMINLQTQNTRFHIKERATKFRFSKSQEIVSKHLSPCRMGAMISAMSTKQLPFPTGSFELIHGSRCQLLPRLHDNLCGADFKSSNLQHKGSYRPWKVTKFYCK
ncbi:hypothetical protein KIW84_066229 [Lathyrus oleraceus]|uniref:Ribosomal RNA-processing protein 8 n=1 Tax=Pisum sativum TaxID=3888 RepID=A0A9D5ABA9_PEA|nr:hypothetical protein KIW84_066229 [Pisum sativum]